MSVRLVEGRIRLEGACPADDAEPLRRLLLDHPGAALDCRACQGTHSAVVQVLLAAQPEIVGEPQSAYLRDWIFPILARVGTRQSDPSRFP